MSSFSLVDQELTVNAVMTRWPATIRIFLDRQMHCVGCPVGGLHTIEEAALAHGLPLDELMTDLAAVVRRSAACRPSAA